MSAARELEDLLALAMRLAREAGALQRAGYEADHEIDTKSQHSDLVTEIDRACEAHLLRALERERPRDAVLAEEGGERARAGATYRWVIDPLDGTTNYAHGYPRFAVSIGVEREGAPALGVVYDPLLDELFHALVGGGAFRNGRPMRVSRESELARSLVATGFSYDKALVDDDNTREFRALLKRAREVRRDGSASLDLCYVARGRFEAYWEFKLSPWDVAAGSLIVCEAGGRVTRHARGRRPPLGPCDPREQRRRARGDARGAGGGARVRVAWRPRRAWLRALVLAAGAGAAHAQGAPPLAPVRAPSPLRALLEDPGKLVVVRRAPLAPLPLEGGGSLVIQGLSVFEPGYEERRLLGVRVDVLGVGLSDAEASHFLELQEVEPLLQAIRLLEEVIATPSQNPTDAEYHGREGFGVGYRTVDGKGERYVRAGREHVVRARLQSDGLARLRGALEGAASGLFGS